jgi:hypothetical protein
MWDVGCEDSKKHGAWSMEQRNCGFEMVEVLLNDEGLRR